MTNIQILNTDFEIIEKFINYARKELKLDIKVENIKESKNREFKSLSKLLDKKIRNSKSINTQKAEKLQKAMEELNSLLDPQKKQLSILEAKEKYYNNKISSL